VKRTVIWTLGLAALGAALVAGKLLADPGARSTTTAPAASPRTRIALVNLSHVIRKYKKFEAYQQEMKKAVEPFANKEKVIQAKGEKLAKEKMDPKTDAARRDAIDKEGKELQRQLEDLKADFQREMAKKQGQQLVILYSDIRRVAERYAVAHNFDVVLHYNDAVDGKDYWSEANVARKMQAGALMPLYYTGGMDISLDIINALNAEFKGKR
jgi:Skp family chaperone for outer membrane proteins